MCLGDQVVLVVLDLQFAAKNISGPTRSVGDVVAEVEALAVAGLVFDHTQPTADDFPAVLTDKPSGFVCQVINQSAWPNVHTVSLSRSITL